MSYISQECVKRVDKIDEIIQELINEVDKDIMIDTRQSKELFIKIIEIKNKTNEQFDLMLKIIQKITIKN